MKVMKIKMMVLALLSATTVFAAADIEATKQTLVGVVEKSLSKVCGTDCPAFSVIPTFKKNTSSLSQSEDLGFDLTQVDLSGKEPTGISIEVLTNKELGPELTQSIQSTVAAEAKNHTDLNVSVKTKPVASTSGLVNKQAVGTKEILEMARAGMWPLALLLVGLMGLIGIASVFHQKRKTALQAFELANTKTEAEPLKEKIAQKEARAYAEEVVQGRLEDLGRYLEEKALQKDLESLLRVVALFPGDSLSRKIQMSPIVPVMISKAVATAAPLSGSLQLAEWLKTELDVVHWKRLREHTEPVAKISALDPELLAQIFSKIKTANSKALVLNYIESTDWPKLLSSLSSPEKVEVGKSLSLIQEGQPIDAAAQKEVIEALGQVVSGVGQGSPLSEYMYYLTDKELSDLRKNISTTLATEPKSVEQVLSSLNERRLLELVLALDVDQIATLLNQLSDQPQKRVMAALPRKLKERIDSIRNVEESETEQASKWMETRSRLMKIYTQNPRSLH